jgi:tRNA nucleotidyltransferase (CCA-adding enzyme)
MNTRENINLSLPIKDYLSTEIIAFTRLAGTIAEKRNMRLYLVGGVVRDLLLERFNTDLDIAVEGDAIKLAQEIALNLQAKITTHLRFKTATLKWGKRSVDLITTRAETYARPGALPKVTPGAIKDDLARRDFSINAMAVSLNPDNYGELYDPYGGRTDLDKGIICVLHDKSFTDDATRIWRAVRYEQRLDFRIEPVTLLLIKRDIDMLKTVSGDRIRHELERVLKEEEPEKILCRADELGILEKLNPYLKGDAWLTEKYTTARDRCKTDLPGPYLYLALLCYRLIPEDAEKLIKYLHLPRAAAEAIKDTQAIKANIKELSLDGQSPSVIYDILHGYSTIAYEANMIASRSATAAEHIELYENVLKHVHPALTGDDLKQLGVPKGPKIKEALKHLLDARLDGLIESKADEETWVKERLLP